jgi:hypothetical protein
MAAPEATPGRDTYNKAISGGQKIARGRKTTPRVRIVGNGVVNSPSCRDVICERLVWSADVSRKAKVAQLDLPSVCDQEIFRLYVSVDYIFVVDERYRRDELFGTKTIKRRRESSGKTQHRQRELPRFITARLREGKECAKRVSDRAGNGPGT